MARSRATACGHSNRLTHAHGMCSICYSASWRVRNKDNAELKAKAIEACRKWRTKNPERAKSARLANHLYKRYNLSLEAYHQMAKAQDYLCAICLRSASFNRLAVDHNHATAKIRGLLCHQCNAGLGNFADSSERLQAAIAYLAQWEHTHAHE